MIWYSQFLKKRSYASLFLFTLKFDIQHIGARGRRLQPPQHPECPGLMRRARRISQNRKKKLTPDQIYVFVFAGVKNKTVECHPDTKKRWCYTRFVSYYLPLRKNKSTLRQ